MKKIMILLGLLIPLNVYAINEDNLHIKADITNIDNFNTDIKINYYDEEKIDPPLLNFTLNKANNYELSLVKGIDFTHFIYDSISFSNNKYYKVDITKDSFNNTLFYTIKVLNEVPFNESDISIEEGNASDLVIEKTTSTTTTNSTTTTSSTIKQVNNQEEINKRNKIYKNILLIVMGLIILISIFVIIKFAKSNK